MLVGPEKADTGPNEPPPVKPGHRGQLARLIRERLVSVNLPGQVRRSEVRELKEAGSGSRPPIEKRSANQELAGICVSDPGENGFGRWVPQASMNSGIWTPRRSKW